MARKRQAQAGDGHSQKWRQNNPEKNLQYYLKYQYGLTVAEYQDLEAQQGSGCAICGGPPCGPKGGKRFVVDHDHVTGKVRGLLCGYCNLVLGQAKESPTILRKAVEYLEAHGRRAAA